MRRYTDELAADRRTCRKAEAAKAPPAATVELPCGCAKIPMPHVADQDSRGHTAWRCIYCDALKGVTVRAATERERRYA